MIERVEDLEEPLLAWYAAQARELPWRSSLATPWSVLVSEFMLQQTPVARVLPVHEAWLRRWASPAALSADGPGEAVRMWGRLGYPRRALRLHAAAGVIVAEHGGTVPEEYAALRRLPGVGDYTAAAVAVFAFGHRHLVLDTNVRRVLSRVLAGAELPPPSPTRAERVRAEQVLPEDPATAAAWSVAVMELGALVCTAGNPRCEGCPLRDRCAWRSAGHPAHSGIRRRAQAWTGTDRQCRGRLLAVLRDSVGPVPGSLLGSVWADAEQRERCLAGLVADGLAVEVSPEGYSLP